MKMKFLIKKWHSYVKNMADEDSIFLKTRKNLINYVKNNPEVNKTINLDKPKGSKKKGPAAEGVALEVTLSIA